MKGRKEAVISFQQSEEERIKNEKIEGCLVLAGRVNQQPTKHSLINHQHFGIMTINNQPSTKYNLTNYQHFSIKTINNQPSTINYVQPTR